MLFVPCGPQARRGSGRPGAVTGATHAMLEVVRRETSTSTEPGTGAGRREPAGRPQAGVRLLCSARSSAGGAAASGPHQQGAGSRRLGPAPGLPALGRQGQDYLMASSPSPQ